MYVRTCVYSTVHATNKGMTNNLEYSMLKNVIVVFSSLSQG